MLFEHVLKAQDPVWSMGSAEANSWSSDAQTTLPPTVNWFDEQAMPSGRWEVVPPDVSEQFTLVTPPENASESTAAPGGANFLTGKAPDSLGGTDPFVWWATTSTSQPKSVPLPGTFPWSAPIRKAGSNLSARSRSGQLNRRKLVTVLVAGAAAVGVTVTGISFVRFLQSTQQTSGSSTGGQAAVSGGGTAPTTGPSQGTRTTTPSASTSAHPSGTKGANGSPTAPTPRPGHTGTVIGSTSQANDSAVSFTNPATGNASLLIRMSNGNFITCEKACTHEGVACYYDKGNQKVVCPRHDATFDPANGFSQTSPAPSPLPRVNIRVNPDGTITTG